MSYTSGHALRRRSNAKEVDLYPALAVSVAVDDLKRNQTFWNANFVYLALIYVMKVPNSSEKKS